MQHFGRRGTAWVRAAAFAAAGLTAVHRLDGAAVMHPTQAQLQRWTEEYWALSEAPRAPRRAQSELSPPTASGPGYFSLLEHLDYNPWERHQGACGNCWVWAGAGVLEIALSVQNGIRNRLSIQFLNSCKIDAEYACCGGNVVAFADWYRFIAYAIPWRNNNAGYADGGQICQNVYSPVPCGWIDKTSAHYPISYIQPYRIPTFLVGQQTAIDCIKAVLHQEKAVYLSFFYADHWGWDFFNDYFFESGEDVLWDTSYLCMEGELDPDSGGGHAVLIVGYDESYPSPALHHWIAVNSWGVAPYGDPPQARRPHGIFRIPMYMNYDCCYNPVLGMELWATPKYQFYGIDVMFNASCDCSLSAYSSPLIPAAGSAVEAFSVDPAFPTGADDGCTWSVVSSAPWVHVTTVDGVAGSGLGVGDGVVIYQVDSNPLPQIRFATLTIAGELYVVRQAGVAPAAPTGVHASDGAFSDRVRVEWDPSAGADSYSVYRRLQSAPYGIFVLIGETGETSFDDTGVVAVSTYLYRVRAVNAFGTSADSGQDSGFACMQIPLPEAPASVTASDGEFTDRVQITWPPAAGAGWYKLYRAPVQQGLTQYSVIAEPSQVWFHDFTVTPGALYSYRVRGCNSFATSPDSPADEGYATLQIAPATPTLVSASDGTFAGRVRVTWQPVDHGESYQLVRTKLGGWITIPVEIGEASGPPYDDTTVTPGAHYDYQVRARNAFGQVGGLSAPDEGFAQALAPPPAPGRFFASDGAYPDHVRLTWMPAAGANGYRVYRAPSGSMVVPFSLLAEPTGSPFDDGSILPGTLYQYRVCAFDGDGPGPFSVVDTGYAGSLLPPPAPTITAFARAEGRRALTFTTSFGLYYQVQKCLGTNPSHPFWEAVPIAATARSPLQLQDVQGTGAPVTVFVEVPVQGVAFFRVRAAANPP